MADVHLPLGSPTRSSTFEIPNLCHVYTNGVCQSYSVQYTRGKETSLGYVPKSASFTQG